MTRPPFWTLLVGSGLPVLGNLFWGIVLDRSEAHIILATANAAYGALMMWFLLTVVSR